MNGVFNGSITICILFNTLLLSLDEYSYPMDHSYLKTLEALNEVLHWIFCVEMIIKLVGFGFKGYVQDKFNIFDGTVVLISVVEYILNELPNIDF